MLYKWSDRQIELSDHNLFFHTAGEALPVGGPALPESLSLAEWQSLGYDQNSVVADPLFVDAAHDDYRLRPESPALGLGFQPIDMTQIGIRPEDHE